VREGKCWGLNTDTPSRDAAFYSSWYNSENSNSVMASVNWPLLQHVSVRWNNQLLQPWTSLAAKK